MPRRIEEDHSQFRDVISGKIRKALKKFVKSGQITRARGKNGKISINIPKIDIPHIVYGQGDSGIKRGEGKEGDVIGQDPKKGKGNQAGQDSVEGISISLDLEEVLKFMQDELGLPNVKPKPSEIFDEIKITDYLSPTAQVLFKYNPVKWFFIGADGTYHYVYKDVQPLSFNISLGLQI